VLSGYILSNHARGVLAEREILESWVWDTIAEPDNTWPGEDGNRHYAKQIAERNGRILHVVVNPMVDPQRIVTAFFDRRLKKKEADETQD
jgi:hypothetical protein